SIDQDSFQNRRYRRLDFAERILSQWFSTPTAEFDAIRIIRRGPGSGKSSLAKRLARLVIDGARSGRAPAPWPQYVLYIPLQRVSGHLEQVPVAFDRYLSSYEGFSTSPLE